ncbi:RHS domain-containing protein [Burkholderia anthina]|uniref:RHS domain-containing protein n=1 Tax=Burkholderia anthina TaxID=179879 RepID=UPI00244630AF|nr:RHS domain-containing protein [Burkholderia anthina]
MGAVRHACEKCEQGGSFTSQLHRNERRFDSLSGKFDVISPETSAVGPLISISLASQVRSVWQFEDETTRICYFHTDRVGTSLEVIDEAGELMWIGQGAAWGMVKVRNW